MPIVEYENRFKDDVINLLAVRQPPKYTELKNKIWDWQYSDNPAAANLSKGLVIVDNDETVGFTAIMPVVLKYKGNIIKAQWTVDGIVDSKCRGKGYGKSLYTAIKEKNDLTIVYGMSDTSSYICLKLGYKANTEIEDHFFTTKARNIKDLIKIALQQTKILRSYFKRPGTKGYSINIIDASEAPKSIDELWNKVESGYSNIIVRDYSYIKWKYGDHPLAKYKLILVEKDNSLAAVGIFRQSSGVSKLIDYVGPAQDLSLKFLVAKTFKKLCASSYKLECSTTDKEFKAALKYLGYKTRKQKPRFYVYSGIENDHDIETDWFIMTGDSDNDLCDFDTF